MEKNARSTITKQLQQLFYLTIYTKFKPVNIAADIKKISQFE